MKVNIRSFLSPTQKNVVFLIVKSNASSIISVGYGQKSLGSRLSPYPVAEIRGVTTYEADRFYLFPYTINIPQAKEAFNAMSNATVPWKILTNGQGGDTWKFEFAKSVNGTLVQKETWLFDADTHLATKIVIKHLGNPVRTTSITVKDHSEGLQGSDELTILSIAGRVMGLFLVPVAIWKLYKTRVKQSNENIVEREKRRIQTGDATDSSSKRNTNKY